ncbi:MAG: hypothetical protein ACHQVS_00635 [Candidatus Babeliales bacterium]
MDTKVVIDKIEIIWDEGSIQTLDEFFDELAKEDHEKELEIRDNVGPNKYAKYLAMLDDVGRDEG